MSAADALDSLVPALSFAQTAGMNPASGAFDVFMAVLRLVFFWFAVALAVVAGLDWLVRTRRLSPFSAVARFTRQTIDPLFRPMERAVVRAGGNPAAAPWWALVVVVISGLVVLSLLEFLRQRAAVISVAAASGPSGLAFVAISLVFQMLRLALIVRVISSWFGASAYSRWVRWAYVLTEPFLGPLRRLLPTLGMIDLSPIVAWLLLGLLEAVLLRAF